ncbi:MAG: PmoA family protein [Armatimonadetes bacterium]|nr:PmoA family protein [Armatimonadota bacterium]
MRLVGAMALGLAMLLYGAAKPQKGIVDAKRTIVVRALNNDYPTTPLSIKLDGLSVPGELSPALVDLESRELVPAQLMRADGGLYLMWIERQLKRGQAKRYRLVFAKAAEVKPLALVKEADKAVEVYINGEFVTAYRYGDAPKPYYYPLIGPTGKAVTRHFPMRTDVKGERADHPHHRSMWFTFGDVNGVDFWTEGARAGVIKHRSFEAVEGGPVFARLVARCDWVAPDGKRLLEDLRELIVYCVDGARLFDFNVTLYAAEEDVKFGDTKEGMFGLRVASSMQVEGGSGQIINSRGDKNAEAWGKRAEWCDYSGTVNGDRVGIAIFDHPNNLRHPTYWHVRTYGLFAANPFGVRSFTGSGDGSHILRRGTSLKFQYRVFIHRGDLSSANVASFYRAYAEPPSISFE